MNWIKVSERMPNPKRGTSDIVLVWVVEDRARSRFSFPAVAFYSQSSGDWVDKDGSITTKGWQVTHWAEVEPPK